MSEINVQAKKRVLTIDTTEIPEEILKYGFEFEIDVSKVWALESPVLNFPIKDLIWHMKVTPWDYEEKPFSIGPKEVMDDPNIYSEHYKRIKNADLSYPIDISYNNGRWLIIDGLHRLCSRIIEGADVERDTIKVRIHAREAIIACIDKTLTASHILKKYGIQKETHKNVLPSQNLKTPDELLPLSEPCVFSPEKHLSFSSPERVINLQDIGYSSEFVREMACEVAYTSPFRLLSDEGLASLRDVADNLLERKGTLSNGALDEFGNAAYLSPFMKSLGQSLDTCAFLSSVTNTLVVPYIRQHFLAALNVGIPSKDRQVRNWHSDYQSLNLIVFLDDPQNFTGGKLEVYKGTKEEADALLKANNTLDERKVETIVPPAAGYAVLIQGSLVKHAVTALDEDDPNRRTLVLGYRSNLLGKNVFEHSGIAPDHPMCRYPEAAKQAASIAIQKLTAFIETDVYTGDPDLILKMIGESLSEVNEVSESLKIAPKMGE